MTYPLTPEVKTFLSPEEYQTLQALLAQGIEIAPDLSPASIQGMVRGRMDYEASMASDYRSTPMPEGKADFPIGMIDGQLIEDEDET